MFYLFKKYIQVKENFLLSHFTVCFLSLDVWPEVVRKHEGMVFK